MEVKVVRCETLEILLEEYVQEGLPAEESQLVDNHLAKCCKCRSLVEQYRELTTGLSDTLASIEIPACLDQVVLGKVNSLYSRRSWKKGLAIAASFLILTIGTIHYSPNAGRIAGGMAELASQILGGDSGVRVASQYNYRQEVGKSQTIDGITMVIDHIVADSSRLIITFSISAEDQWYEQYGANAIIRPQGLQVYSHSTALKESFPLDTSFSAGDDQQLSFSNLDPGIVGSLVINRGDLGERIVISSGVMIEYFQRTSTLTGQELLTPRFEFEIISHRGRF